LLLRASFEQRRREQSQFTCERHWQRVRESKPIDISAAAWSRLRSLQEIFDQLRDIPNRLGWGDQATAG
jgi:hypothetical protein